MTAVADIQLPDWAFEYGVFVWVGGGTYDGKYQYVVFCQSIRGFGRDADLAYFDDRKTAEQVRTEIKTRLAVYHALRG